MGAAEGIIIGKILNSKFIKGLRHSAVGRGLSAKKQKVSALADNIKSSCRSKRKLMPHIESNYTLSCIELCELCIAA